jgi:hypothetical protein
MRYLAPILALLLTAAIFAPAMGPAMGQPARARAGVRSGEVRSLGDIVNGIRRDRPGSLADVQGPAAGPLGEPHYRIKWLTPDGRVLWLDTDARTGRVLGVQGQDRFVGPPRGNFTPPRLGGGNRGLERGPARGPEPGPGRGFDRGPPRGGNIGRGPRGGGRGFFGGRGRNGR